MPDPLFTIIAETNKTYGKELTDQVFDSHPLWWKLKKTQQPFDGHTIVERVQVDDNSNVDWRSAKAAVPLAEQDFLRQIQYGKFSITGSVVLWKKEVRENQSAAGLRNLVRDSMKNGYDTIADKLGKGLYNTGAAGGPVGASFASAVDGLPMIIDSGSTYATLLDQNGNVEGAIDPATYTWWASTEKSTSEALSLNAGTDLGMYRAYNSCIYGNEKPNMILTTMALFEKYIQLMAGAVIYRSDELLDAGFSNAMFQDAPVTWDNFCNSGTMYFVNTKFLKLRPASWCAESVTTEPAMDMTANGLLATAALLWWDGNLVCTSRRHQAKMTSKS
jgi:hypothetical protein